MLLIGMIATILVLLFPDFVGYHRPIPSYFEGATVDNLLSWLYATANIEANFAIIWFLLWGINIGLICSPLRGTMGIKLSGLFLAAENEGQHIRPALSHALRYVLFGGVFLTVHVYLLYRLCAALPMDLYRSSNVIFLLFGTAAACGLFYRFKFGSAMNACEYLTGLQIQFTAKHLEKLEMKSAKGRGFREKWMKLDGMVWRFIKLPSLIILIYWSGLVFADFF